MKQTTKKIIAREGLIILSFVLFAALSFFLNLWVHHKRTAYQVNVHELEIVMQTENAKNIIPPRGIVDPFDKMYKRTDELIRQVERGKSLISQGIKVQFPTDTPNDIIEKTLRKDFPDIKDIDWIVWDNNDNTNIKKAYDKQGNQMFDSLFYRIDLSNIYIFFLLFAYPIYLIFRFIIWSIKILKGTPNKSVQ